MPNNNIIILSQTEYKLELNMFAYAQDMQFGYLNLQNIPSIAFCVTSKTTKF